MSESTESSSSAVTETKKIINPRAEIDTSLPYESVKEAVDMFGGSGPWIPHHLLRLAADHHDSEAYNVEMMEEHAVQLQRELIMKEQETLNVLKQLEAAKRYVDALKINLIPELSSFMATSDSNSENPMNDNSSERLNLCPFLSPGLLFMELNQAKLNLNKTSIDLAVIQESVESLNKKMRKEKFFLEKKNKLQMPTCEGVMYRRSNPPSDRKADAKMNGEDSSNVSTDFETDQFKKMTEASRYEVMKAMAEIERTKNSIKMAEMRLNAAKKMEEAAKAIEAISIAERNALLSGENSHMLLKNDGDGITLSIEEYHSLTQKALQVDEMCKNKYIDTKEENRQEVTILEETKKEVGVVEKGPFENRYSKFKFRNSRSALKNPQVICDEESTTSMADILTRNVNLQDGSQRPHVSLSQMLRDQSRLILHPSKTTEEGSVETRYVVEKKRFGFIQVPIHIKKTKKKTQPLNVR